jgi:hypothetical protein
MSMNSMLAGGVNITQTCTTGGGANAAWHVAGCSVGGGTAVVIAAAWIISYMCARRCRSPVLPTSSAASSSHIVPAEHAAPPPATHFYMPHPYPPPSFPCPSMPLAPSISRVLCAAEAAEHEQFRRSAGYL